GHCHRSDVREVLLYHPDSSLDRVRRRSDRVSRISCDRPSGVWSNQAESDAHESRLSRTVLTEQRMHGPRSQLERRVVECQASAVALRDAAQGEHDGAARWRAWRGHNPVGASMKVDVSLNSLASRSPSARTPSVSVA